MKADFLEFIFQPFERERNDFTNFTEGTGLGMAITKKLVELMSGNINVQSELGIGSVFTINIPFQISSNEDTYDLRGFENLNVLIIASTKTIVESASSFLTELDVKHQKTINGSEGILLAKKACENNRDFDAIIIGPKMEDLDGIDVAKSIRRVTNRDKTQVFLAVYEESVYQGKGYDEYIDALVLKPLYKTHIYKLLKSKCVDHTKENVLKFKRKKPQYKARILLVEDNELNMEIAKEILKSYGIRIEEATDGLEAFSALSTKEENYYDLIFMDCQMPHMDGLEATEAIVKFENNSQRNHTPIVAMTANAFDEDRKNALAAGMDDFLVKPLDVKELENILSKFLDSAN
jgi:CheY-like chemotaxis protein